MDEALGPVGLFFSAFLAATLLPFSSEAAFAAALCHGMDGTVALLAASAGNVLAVLLNFGLGLLLHETTRSRLEGSRFGRRALVWARQKGYWALLLSPLPLVGDPVTLAAGLVRLRFVWFLLIAGGLRVLRYWAIMQLL
jgi:membrane protein YqaA with SNARE-associated domain